MRRRVGAVGASRRGIRQVAVHNDAQATVGFNLKVAHRLFLKADVVDFLKVVVHGRVEADASQAADGVAKGRLTVHEHVAGELGGGAHVVVGGTGHVHLHVAAVVGAVVGKDAGQGAEGDGLVTTRPVLGHQIRDGTHWVVTAQGFGEVVNAPRLAAHVQHGHVLAGLDLARSQCAGIAQDFVVTVQVVPERHIQQATTGLSQGVQRVVVGDDATHVELGQFSGAVKEVRVKYFGNDYICNLSHSDIPISGLGFSGCAGAALPLPQLTPASALSRAACSGLSRRIWPCLLKLKVSFFHGLSLWPEPLRLPGAPLPLGVGNQWGRASR